MKVLKRFWRPYAKSFWISWATLTIVAIVVSVFLIPYRANITLHVSDNTNNFGISTVSQSESGKGSTEVLKKGNSFLRKNIELLKTEEFFTLLLEKVKSDLNAPESLVRLSSQNFDAFAAALDDSFSFDIRNEYEVALNSESNDQATATTVATYLKELVPQFLVLKEQQENGKAKQYLEEEFQKTNSEIKALVQEIQKQPSGGDMGKFTTTDDDFLRSKALDQIRDYETKIAQNREMINTLEEKVNPNAPPSLYGVGGAIQQLNFKNQIYLSSIRNLKRQLQRYSKAGQDSLAQNMETRLIQDKLENKKSYLNALSAKLDKISVSKLVLEERYQVLSKGGSLHARPLVSLKTLLFLAFFFAGLFTVALAFLNSIWNAETEPLHERNVLVVADHDDHSENGFFPKPKDGDKKLKLQSIHQVLIQEER